jgi:translation initiation factor IF-1
MKNGAGCGSLDSGPQIRATLSGRMQGHRIRVVAGDRVSVELSPHDLSLGRVVYRFQ